MKHRMTIWADWNQIFDRVHVILPVDLAHRNQMMNMNKSGTDLAVIVEETELANCTRSAMGLNALPTCFC